MLIGVTRKLRLLFSKKWPLTQEEKFKFEIQFGYPSNHTYQISSGKLKPRYKLAQRYQCIQQLFPANMTSMVDIGCSKGYFVFSASNLPACTRNLGIDVHQEDIDVCLYVKKRVHNKQVSFAKMQLHELANSIEQFGGKFQTVLLLNIYQYLYFGSVGHPECYLDHDSIFANLKKICSQRVIFNNRIDFSDCQQQVKLRQLPALHGENYTTEKILSTAQKYFTIKEYGAFGKYPLLALDV
jgi:hypothetical protein